MRFGITYATTPTEYPITAEQLKLHSHADGNDEDENFGLYVQAATRLAEKRLDRQIVTATLRVTYDKFPCATRQNPESAIYLPRPPLQSVTSIGYVDTNGTTQTMATTDYIVDANSEPGRITPRYGDIWPTPRDQMNAVTVTYVAGYGNASAVPSSIKQWMLVVGAHWYRNREAVNIGNITSPLEYMDALLMQESYGGV